MIFHNLYLIIFIIKFQIKFYESVKTKNNISFLIVPKNFV